MSIRSAVFNAIDESVEDFYLWGVGQSNYEQLVKSLKRWYHDLQDVETKTIMGYIQEFFEGE